MHKITKTFIDAFNLKMDTGVKIALYGIGNNTKILVEELKEYSNYNIVCLMDAQNEGKVIYGLNVCSLKEVILMADIVVIIARDSVIDLIYQRIKCLEKRKIYIYNVYGEKLQEKETTNYHIDSRLQNCKLSSVIEMINTHDIISFDIFDTIIMRTTAFPRDVFGIVERKLKDCGVDIKNFSTMRIEAERLAEITSIPSFEDIYNELEKNFGINNETIKKIKMIEIETERQLLVQRKQVCMLLNYAKGVGKRVILTSDMYYGTEVITSFLDSLNIKGYDDIYISNELYSKKADRLFEIIRKRESGNILHIGDSIDDMQGKKYGLDCIRIYSAVDMLGMSPICELNQALGSIENNVLIGKMLSVIYNSPFYFSQNTDILLEDVTQLAYVLLGPLLTCFEDWLINNVDMDKNATILFSARDGYLQKRIYETDDKCSKKPKAQYLFTSRVAAQGINISSQTMLLNALNKKYEGTVENLFLDRLGYVPEGLEDKVAHINVDENNNMEMIKSIVLSYQEQLMSYSNNSKVAFKKYFDNLGIVDNKIFFVDFIAAGSVQHFLEDALECKMKGRYYSQMEKDDDSKSEIDSFLGKYDDYKPPYYLQKYSLLLEAIILCPCGMCIGYDEMVKFKFREDVRNDVDIAMIMDLQEKAIDFFRKLRDLCMNMDYSICIQYIDCIFKLICDGHIKLSEKLENMFNLENYYDGQDKKNVFEWYGLKK